MKSIIKVGNKILTYKRVKDNINQSNQSVPLKKFPKKKAEPLASRLKQWHHLGRNIKFIYKVVNEKLKSKKCQNFAQIP
ncbi:hypothetical protein Avbf_15411 [Armadillidium vulgare]|nr:hypothetical protein Avbf_15411 [Armadillidium vulgare]